jgi:AraC-like DNA-binding protein
MKGKALENFVRDSVGTYWHQTCTAKMGRDSMSVVDAQLKVYGIENLRIADGSIMPRVTTGNTMAPCIIIGERAGELLRTAYKLSGVEAYSDQGAALRFVNAERLAGFPSGRLLLDSVEQALAAALVDGHAVRRPSLRKYRGGLSPARLRRVTELVLGKVEDELTLQEMAESAGLSMTHFSQMFRRSTGESPHQFVLRHRVERAKEMLRAAEARVLDVAVACGFKTQQHFARVFRRVCGASPTEYREEFLR